MKGSQPGTVERRWEQWSRGINGIEGILELRSGENELERSYWLESRQTKQSNGGTWHMTREQVAEGKVLTELFRN